MRNTKYHSKLKFSVVLMPLYHTGCVYAQYPWTHLSLVLTSAQHYVPLLVSLNVNFSP